MSTIIFPQLSQIFSSKYLVSGFFKFSSRAQINIYVILYVNPNIQKTSIENAFHKKISQMMHLAVESLSAPFLSRSIVQL